MVQERKIKAVQQLADKFKQAKHFIFTEYKGLNVEQINELRKKLREVNSELRVVKNRLAKLAYKKIEVNLKDEWFSGPVALVLCLDDDFSNTVSIIYKFSKNNEQLKIKLGYLEKKVFNIDQLKTISSLPSKKELIAKLAGILNAPVVKLVSVLKNIIRKPVLVLKAIEDKKNQQ